MTDWFQVILAGALQGGTYGLTAMGLSLSLGLLGGVNLTHGEWVMSGGWLTIVLAGLGFSPLWGVPVSSVAVGLAALCLYHILLKKTFEVSPEELPRTSLLVTLGLAFMIEDFAGYCSKSPIWSLNLPLKSFHLGSVTISGIRILVLACMAAAAAIAWLILMRTDRGRSVRAVIQDRDGALLMGVPLRRLQGDVFAAAAALSALAGGFTVLLFSAWPRMGLPLVLKCLYLVVLGGTGSVWTPLIGGLWMGWGEAVLGVIGDGRWAQPVTLSLLLAAIVIRHGMSRPWRCRNA